MTKIKKVGIGKKYKNQEVIEKGFLNVYEDYILDEFEINTLIDGEEIKILSLKNLKGVAEVIFLRLEELEDNWAVVQGIPLQTSSHVWSKSERELLYRGEKIQVDFLDTKKLIYCSKIAKWDSEKRQIIFE